MAAHIDLAIRRLVRAVKTLPGAPAVRLSIRAWKNDLRSWRATRRRRRLSTTRFIAVTGSAGKTTTTELAARMLATLMPCQARSGWNTYDGITATILSAKPSGGLWVQEMSGERPGAISRSCALLQPEIGIVTSIGSDHRAAYKSLEATAAEKGKLIEALPATGLAVLNADDPLVVGMASRSSARVVTFGRSGTADLRAHEISARFPDRLSLVAEWRGMTLPVRTQLIGEFWLTPVLAALACALELGADPTACATALAGFAPIAGRCSPHRLASGADIVLDTQKAPGWTVPATLAIARDARASRKTLVFGSLSDFSGKSGRFYRRVARQALEVADRVAFVGPHAPHVRGLVGTAGAGRLTILFQAAELAVYLETNTGPGDLVIVKASRVDGLTTVLGGDRGTSSPAPEAPR
ncbi:MAG: Mur ligase family protein [Bauldia sp.]